MLSQDQANRLANAGLTAYNHNLDTSPEFYNQIITTRTFNERLETLKTIRNAGIDICSGGIIGLGESIRDRARLLEILSNLNPHPESVPINALVPVKGTPLENNKPVEPIEIIRMVATARIIIPKARIRLSAGRKNLNKEAQIMCFFAGANSIFYGDKLLTTKNNKENEDIKLLNEIGLKVVKN
jgi:biotin synthase